MNYSYKKCLLSQQVITYRNCLYQGYINVECQTKQRFGIIYIAKSHQFICCKNWTNDLIQDECFFFNSDQYYSYGFWHRNKPHGFNVFRIQETIVMLEFNHAKLIKNTKIILCFLKYNFAVILNVTNHADTLEQVQFQLITKKQLFSSQDLFQLFKLAMWPQSYFVQAQTLIRFISTQMIVLSNNKKNINPIKLRLIENKYYRFGYDNGLAIIFDQDTKRISVGLHKKSHLASFGALFNRQQLNTHIEQGIFNQQNSTVSFKSNNIALQDNKKINKTYRKNLLMSVNYCNKFYKNPSKIYQLFIKNLLNKDLVKNLFIGLITTRNLYEDSLRSSKYQTHNYQQVQHQYNIKQRNKYQQQINLNKKRQNLDDPAKVHTIRKQRYGSIRKKQITLDQSNQNSNINNEEINKNQSRNIINHKQIGTKEERQLQKSNYNTPSKFEEKQKSRKKIFQQSQKNLKVLKDYTPSKSQKQLTPFKTKMKNRIFYRNNTIQGPLQQFMKDFDQQSQKSINIKDRYYQDSFDQSIGDKSLYHNNKSYKDIEKDKFTYLPIKKDPYLIKIQDSSSQFRDIHSRTSTHIQNSNKIYVPIDQNYQKSKKKSTSTLKDQITTHNPVKSQYNRQKYLQKSENTNEAPFEQNVQSYRNLHSKSLKKQDYTNRRQNPKQIQEQAKQKIGISKDNKLKVLQSQTAKTPIKRSQFKHSNQIYLSNKSVSTLQQANHNEIKKKTEISPLRQVNKSSYSKKYQQRQEIQKQIQRSPDRTRCYGKDNQNPYIQQNNYHKSKVNHNQIIQDSTQSVYHDQSSNFNHDYKRKFF